MVNDIYIDILKDNRDLISKFSNLHFIINRKKYNLVATINVPTNNHYTSFIINYKNTINNIEMDGTYYYDDLNNPPYVKKITFNDSIEQTIINSISLKNLYILIYEKEL